MVDTERLYIHANEQLAAQYGKTVTIQTIAKMMGRGTLESIRIYADDLHLPVAPELLLEQRQAIMLGLLATDLQPMPYLREILALAKPLFRLGLVTGSSGRLMSDVLTRLDLAGFFDVEQCCDGIELGKPHPEIYLRACRRLDLTPSSCIVLEDSANGVRSGRAAGCYVIAVPNEHTSAQDFSQANIVVPNLKAAMDHIQQIA